MKNIENKNFINNNLIKFIIIFTTTFLIELILCITQGYMRADEYAEYAQSVNGNIMTALGPLMFMGPFYTFIIAIIVSILSKIFIKKDEKLKKYLCFSPIYVILLNIPVWLCTPYVYEFFMMLF